MRKLPWMQVLVASCLLGLLPACMANPVVGQPRTGAALPTEAFTIVVLGDSQYLVDPAYPDGGLMRLTSWIVRSIESHSIAFVTHVGDVVNDATDDGQWLRADAALGLLDGTVPYSVAFGNHDYASLNHVDSSTTRFRWFFGPRRYANAAWYVGSSPDGLSHAQRFVAGGVTFLHVALVWEGGDASDPVNGVGWARSVLERFPGVPTILTTHAYLWDAPGKEGRYPLEARSGFRSNGGGEHRLVGWSGEGLFEQLVAPFPHVIAVVGGHFHELGHAAGGQYTQLSSSPYGVEVLEVLANFQEYPDGGADLVRLITFTPSSDPEAGTVEVAVSTYAPLRDRTIEEASSRFSWTLDWNTRFPQRSSTPSP